jgi:dynactin complex subunit
MEDPHLPGVGTRFSAGSFRGTIRYVGEVEGTEGVWLGVEWDDANRGKHSGTRGETTYFTCR